MHCTFADLGSNKVLLLQSSSSSRKSTGMIPPNKAISVNTLWGFLCHQELGALSNCCKAATKTCLHYISVTAVRHTIVSVQKNIYKAKQNPEKILFHNIQHFINFVCQPSTLSSWSHWPRGPVDLKSYWPPGKSTGPHFSPTDVYIRD